MTHFPTASKHKLLTFQLINDKTDIDRTVYQLLRHTTNLQFIPVFLLLAVVQYVFQPLSIMRTINASLLIIAAFVVSGTIGFQLKCLLVEFVSCEVIDVVSTNLNNVITSVNVSSDSLNGIDKLVMRDQKDVSLVPKNIAFFFRELKHLEISNSKLEWIGHKDIKEIAALNTLDLRSNRLELLEKDLFDYNRELETINLSNNRLVFVHERIFRNLYRLTSIDLEHNPCTRLMYPTDSNSYSRRSRSVEEYDYVIEYNNNNENHTDYPSYLKNFSVDVEDYVQIGLHNYCQSWESAHEIYQRKYEKEISDLKSDKSKLRNRLTTCSGNLNAALTNYRQQKSINSNMESIEDPIESLMVNLTPFNFSCVATHFTIPFPNSSIGTNWDCNSSTSLNIHQKQSLFLPQNLAEKFPHINELTVTESGLCEIDYNVLRGLNLITLNLTKNKIAEIPVHTFADLSDLQELNLSFNRLQTLYDGVFASLKNLKRLYLNNNFLKTIKMGDLQHLERLRFLFLQNNRLKFIDATLFSTFSRLELLDLSSNVCIDTSYPTSTFEDIETTITKSCIPPVELICKLVEIEASENVGEHCEVENLLIEYPNSKISKLNGVEVPNESIKIFSADKQSIKFIPIEFSQQLPHLKRIDIQRSNLTSLHEMDFAGFSALTEIVINNNNLSSISHGTFDTIPQLQLLDLSSNDLDILPMNVFTNLRNLHTLLLSNNRIHRFSANFMPQKNSIDTFRVDNNQLDFIETKAVHFLRKASLVDFTGNNCIDMKFAENEPSTQTLREVVGEIELNCSDE